MSLFNQQDEPVLVAINERGVFIIDNMNGVSWTFWMIDEIKRVLCAHLWSKTNAVLFFFRRHFYLD